MMAVVNILISLTLLIIGLSLVRGSLKKRKHHRTVELTSGMIAVSAGIFIMTWYFGSAILKLIDNSDPVSSIKNRMPGTFFPGETAMQKRIRYLQKYVPRGALANADPRFATYAGTASSPRLPLVFPYEIRINPDDGSGILALHTGDAPVDDPSSVKPLLDGIEKANFNNRCLVAQIAVKSGDGKAIKYVLFSFATGNSDTYESSDKLWQAANDEGYSGGEIMYPPATLREEYFQDTAETF